MKVGIVNFINTAPFYEPWKELGTPRGWEVVEGAPSHLNLLLKKGEIDAGLVSSFTYSEAPEDLLVMKDISISAAGPVKSVLFLSQTPLEELTYGATITVTTRSATSVMLLWIILEEFHGKKMDRDFSFRPGDLPSALSSKTPYLAIGDEALALARSGRFKYAYDLAEIWMAKTGLPFVFALMVVRKGSYEGGEARVKALHQHIKRCIKEGLKDLRKIGEKSAPKIPMDPASCIAYLKGIEYDLDTSKQEGLRLFYEYLKGLGAIKEVPGLKLIP